MLGPHGRSGCYKPQVNTNELLASVTRRADGSRDAAVRPARPRALLSTAILSCYQHNQRYHHAGLGSRSIIQLR